MCKVYSKERVFFTELSVMGFHKQQKEVRNIIIKNRNYNTCSGTAFIKP